MATRKKTAKKKKAPVRTPTQTLADKISKRLGRKRSASRAEELSITAEVIPTGIDAIDRYVLGCGGLPVGRITEVYSEEGVGKTSFAYQCIANCQRLGGVAIFADSEHSFDAARARIFGVDLDELIMIEEPDPKAFLTMEKICDEMIATLQTLEPDEGPVLIVWDSVASGTPEAELDPKVLMGKSSAVGLQARIMSRSVRILNTLLFKRRAHLLYINQLRAKIGGFGFGPTTTTPGGKALKYYTSTRLQLINMGAVKRGVFHVGRDMGVTCTKSRTATPWRKAIVRLEYLEGFQDKRATIHLAAKILKVIPEGVKFTDETYARAVAALDEEGWSPF